MCKDCKHSRVNEDPGVRDVYTVVRTCGHPDLVDNINGEVWPAEERLCWKLREYEFGDGPHTGGMSPFYKAFGCGYEGRRWEAEYAFVDPVDARMDTWPKFLKLDLDAIRERGLAQATAEAIDAEAAERRRLAGNPFGVKG